MERYQLDLHLPDLTADEHNYSAAAEVDRSWFEENSDSQGRSEGQGRQGALTEGKRVVADPNVDQQVLNPDVEDQVDDPQIGEGSTA